MYVTHCQVVNFEVAAKAEAVYENIEIQYLADALMTVGIATEFRYQ